MTIYKAHPNQHMNPGMAVSLRMSASGRSSLAHFPKKNLLRRGHRLQLACLGFAEVYLGWAEVYLSVCTLQYRINNYNHVPGIVRVRGSISLVWFTAGVCLEVSLTLHSVLLILLTTLLPDWLTPYAFVLNDLHFSLIITGLLDYFTLLRKTFDLWNVVLPQCQDLWDQW